ncbi:MAG TPA: hypothetical protein VFS66_05815 [Acidimicrobiia bacterium]|nr:hypothetical protein [Acidimicrobiia bacterium]
MAAVSEPNRDAFYAAQIERDRTLLAAREVEDALSRAVGGENWVHELKSSLASLKDAMSAEERELDRPGSLLTLISAEHPRRFGPRIRGIKDQYNDIIRQLESLRRELDGWDREEGDLGDIRHRAGWVILALQNCRNRQADLVFEAIGLDLGKNRDG